MTAIQDSEHIQPEWLTHFSSNSQCFLHYAVHKGNEAAVTALLGAGWCDFECPAEGAPNAWRLYHDGGDDKGYKYYDGAYRSYDFICDYGAFSYSAEHGYGFFCKVGQAAMGMNMVEKAEKRAREEEPHIDEGQEEAEKPKKARLDETVKACLFTLMADQSLLVRQDGTHEVVNGSIDAARARKLIDCQLIDVLECTKGDMSGKYDLWFDDEGQFSHDANRLATQLFGQQIFGGKLYGNVLVTHAEDGEE